MHEKVTIHPNYEFLSGILDFFPILKDSSPQSREEFVNTAILQTFPAKKTLYKEGDKCNYLALVISGIVRVYKTGENRNEITLYRVGRGECCFLTASCVMENISFPAIAEVEKQVEVALIPSAILQEWVKKHESWRKYLFHLLANRLSNVTSTLNQIAFQKIDKRLAYLLLKENKENTVKMTHHEAAVELGTAREVVSRVLKEFEKEGAIKLGRGKIIILNIDYFIRKLEGYY